MSVENGNMDKSPKLSALRKAELLINEKRPSDKLLRFEVSTPQTIERSLSMPDLTAEDAPPHIINIIKDKVVEKLSDLRMGNIRIVRGNPVVSVTDNYDKLLFPYDNAGRSSTYTRYTDEDHVLRTHMSALVPETLKKFHDEVGEDIPDTVFVFPGLVYRRDVIDPKHLDVFHQIDIWTLRKDGNRGSANREDLLRLVDNVFSAVFSSEVKPIVNEVIHPYTIGGIEVYAKSGKSELEVLEAGLAHPEVLKEAGFDPQEYSGLALGMGLDRLVMSFKDIPDIRYLRSTDPRITSQMLNLEKFKNVSDKPPISRDMSYCIPENYTEEDICEEIKEAFGDEAYLIENVKISARTKYDDLPQIAKDRLGAMEGQDNVLVKIILRHPDKTLTKEQANVLYDQAYPRLNKGSKGYLRSEYGG
jgi:phenylalanyl-tRNA synthetase alpha chain